MLDVDDYDQYKRTVRGWMKPSIPVKDAGGLKLPLTTSSEEITWSVTTTTDTDDPNETYVAEKLRGMTGVNVKFVAYPSDTSTTSPFFPTFLTSAIKITFINTSYFINVHYLLKRL